PLSKVMPYESCPVNSQLHKVRIVARRSMTTPTAGSSSRIVLATSPKEPAMKKIPNNEKIAAGRIRTHAESASATSEIVTIQAQEPATIPAEIRRFSHAHERPA